MFLSGLRERMSTKAPASRRGGRTAGPQRPPFRPQVEVLESRTLLSAGSLVPTFGSGGLVTTSFLGVDRAFAVAQLAHGKLVAGGTAFPPDYSQEDFALAQYNVDGSLDQSFGSGGKVLSNFGGRNFASALIVQADGKIVMAGDMLDPVTFASKMLVARYNSDGSLDQSFGTGGSVTTDFGGGLNSYLRGLTLEPDGRIVGVGYVEPPLTSTGDFAVVRYNPDGSLDQSFGSGGKVITNVGGDPFANAVALEGNRIVVVGGEFTLPSFNREAVLVRYYNDGSVDTSFGANGIVTTEFGAKFDGTANGVAIQSNGDIVVAGTVSDPTLFNFDFALARFRPDGSPDPNFGTGGFVRNAVSGHDCQLADLVLQPNGDIVVVGDILDLSTFTDQFAVGRYNPDGSRDQTFGTGGYVRTSFAAGQSCGADAVVLLSNDNLLVAGYTLDPSTGTEKFALAEYFTR